MEGNKDTKLNQTTTIRQIKTIYIASGRCIHSLNEISTTITQSAIHDFILLYSNVYVMTCYYAHLRISVILGLLFKVPSLQSLLQLKKMEVLMLFQFGLYWIKAAVEVR
jgi:uncharacterized membrane protein